MKKIVEKFVIKNLNEGGYYIGDGTDDITGVKPEFGIAGIAKEFDSHREAETEIYDSFASFTEEGSQFAIEKKYVVTRDTDY